jgi:enoyl-CoA hydratase/carnithine racemase
MMQRVETGLILELNRPKKHNAFGREIRDALIDALDLAVVDDSIEHLVLRGRGASFCSGGDLDEFGTTPNPSLAHLVRLDRSVGARIDRLRDRMTVEVHGACIGAGVELPSFAGHVVAAPDAFFQLPELSMGLVPGAGGTVSLTRRIGRYRTAYLALSGARIDAPTAARWGLVDAVD